MSGRLKFDLCAMTLGMLACATAGAQQPAPPPPDTAQPAPAADAARSEEHTSELQSLMRISYAVFCLKKKKQQHTHRTHINTDHRLQYNITVLQDSNMTHQRTQY